MTHKNPQNPRIVLLTGDGKGKTTAALGMALRAVGHGMRVAVFQFIKGRSDTGEVMALSRLPEVEIIQCGLGFVPSHGNQDEYGRHRTAAGDGLKQAGAKLADPGIQMVVLDEICGAVHRALVSENDVLSVLDRAHPAMVVVLTGRNATPGLVRRADTVSRIDCVKHGMQSGWRAQEGVEC
jgi:cob(I)alamin adenosyltransferase